MEAEQILATLLEGLGHKEVAGTCIADEEVVFWLFRTSEKFSTGPRGTGRSGWGPVCLVIRCQLPGWSLEDELRCLITHEAGMVAAIRRWKELILRRKAEIVLDQMLHPGEPKGSELPF